MDSDKLIHDLIVDRLRIRYSREYKEIEVNVAGNPDIILANHGMTVVNIEVETEKSITSEKAGKWEEMLQSGTKLILIVPKSAKVKTMELLWQHGLADRVAVGNYDIAIQMP